MNIKIDLLETMNCISNQKDSRIEQPIDLLEKLQNTRIKNETKDFEYVGMQIYPIEGLPLLNEEEIQSLSVVEFYGISHLNNIDGKYQGNKKLHEPLEADVRLIIYSEYCNNLCNSINQVFENKEEEFNLTEFIVNNDIPVVDVEIGYN